MVSLLLAGCTAGADYAAPPAPASRALSTGKFLRAGEAEAGAPLARWWEALNDPQLDALVASGLAEAPGIAAAEARLRQARTGLASVRAGMQPSAGASVLYARANLPEGSIGEGASNIDLFNVGFDAQWEADLWGGKRRDAERAAADAGAAEARLADARVTLSAEIARTYIALRARQAGLALLGERQALETQLAAIARRRFAGGTAPRQAIEAALAQSERTEAQQAGEAAEIAALTDSLAVLTGQAPGEPGALAAGAIPLPPAQLVIGDPGAMLARRPDIRAAERQLAAASAKIGVEAARRYPSISLMGIIGLGGSSAGDIFDPSKLSTIALPRLSWSFLDFGRIGAAIAGAEAGRDAALADYRAQVLAALLDAESALARFGAARVALARAGSGSSHVREIARLQGLRGKAGTLAPSEVLEARRQEVDARIAESAARAELTLAYAALAKALGLGWQAAEEPGG